MKFGLLTAILEGTTFEEAVDFAAENQLECLEVACWPNTGGAKRRYAGVCHIDAEALTEEKAKEIIQYCKERNVEISSLGYYPNTLDPDLEKRKQYIDHIYALIDASSMLNVNMVTTFLDMNTEYYNKQMQSVLKVFTQFMSTEIELERIIYQKEFDGKFVGCQIMDGDIDVFLGIAGEDADLLCVASTFSQEDMNKFDADAYDAICELINIINGAYATKLSYEEIEVSLHPPVFYQDTQIKADNGMYVVTFNMKGHRFNLLMVADDKVKLNV